MNLKQLEAFVRVAETKNFSEAARQLYLTQPTVSAHISALEKELDICLFIRSTKEVKLSDAGRELYTYAEKMLAIEREIREHFGTSARKGKRILRIAASTIPSQYLLPDIMVRFRRKYPAEQLNVAETESAGVVEQIVSHQADIGFAGTVLDKKHCIYLPFYQDELVVITPGEERFLERRGKEITSWIQDEPMILREKGSGTRKEARKLLRRLGIRLEDLNVAASMENQEAIKRSVESGMGVSILSRLAAEDEIRTGKLLAFPLGKNGGKRNINLVFERGVSLPPSAEKFIGTVREMYPDRKADDTEKDGRL